MASFVKEIAINSTYCLFFPFSSLKKNTEKKVSQQQKKFDLLFFVPCISSEWIIRKREREESEQKVLRKQLVCQFGNRAWERET